MIELLPSTRWAPRLTAVAYVFVTWAAACCVSVTSADEADSTLAAFISRNCLDCHGGEDAESGVRLDRIGASFADADSFSLWVKVHDIVQAGEMPPADAAQPESAARGAFLASLYQSLRATDLVRQAREGRVPLRRLNRVEYEYTLRDLLAIPHLQVKEMLPPDDAAHGFDNVAEAQDFSYVQMARYLEAAEVAIDAAMCLQAPPESSVVRMPFQRIGRFSAKMQRGRGESRHVDDWVVFLRQPNSAQTPWRLDNKRQHDAGWYRFRFFCRGVVYDEGQLLPPDRNHVASLYTGAKRLLHTFDVPAEPDLVEFTAWQNTDELLEFFCASLDDRNSPGAGPIPDRPYRGPGIAVEYLEIEGPLVERWPRESHRRLFGDLPVVPWTPSSGLEPPAQLNLPDLTGNKRLGNPDKRRRPGDLWMVESQSPLEDAERLLRDFLPRAFRRPAEESEVLRCLAFAREGIEKNLCFQDAMRTAYKAALCSPDFLFFQEPVGKLDDDALASRLSYFLWRSQPDDALRSLAESGTLHEPAVLREQVERMLDDEKSARLAADFTGQWLDVREINFTVPDRFLYPEYFCDNHLVESIVLESEAYFAEMLRGDLGARHVVDSDFLMINERLARLYGIPDVEGCVIRRVPIPPGSARGGFVTQASTLKVTANGLSTSPVLRGAWILERLLGDEVPPPPPNAGAIDPDTRGATTVREQLDKHRRDASCASCHVKIDPPGFALENFDVMGAWRDRYRGTDEGEALDMRVADRLVKYTYGPAVDASGVTPDDREFHDIVEFRRLLLNEEDRIARNIAERLLTFGTGGGIGFADRAIVEDLLRRTKDSEYGLRSMIHEVVQSEAFQHK